MPKTEKASTLPTAAGGLAWVCDSDAGIRRVRRKGAFAYLHPDGKPLRDEAVLQRIRKLAIPPAYEDVWICSRPDGHLQATGRDARGRKQYRYHADWHSHRGQTKFDHLRAFGRLLPGLRRRVQAQLGNADEPTRARVLATLVRLLDTTWMRIGNDEYARTNGSFGLSTLRSHHAGVRGAEVRLSFVGKSGVRHDVRLSDRRVAGVVRRCRDLPGQELFRCVDGDGSVHRLGSADVNAWLADATGQHVTAKDFRTWHASVQALDVTLAGCAAAEPPSAAAVVAEVARRLGNTPAVCRKAYIHPAVLALGAALASAAGRSELLARRWVGTPPPARGLTVAERRLMGLLGLAAQRPREPASRGASTGTTIAAVAAPSTTAQRHAKPSPPVPARGRRRVDAPAV